jgi:hypothetical protein
MTFANHFSQGTKKNAWRRSGGEEDSTIFKLREKLESRA